MARDRINKTDTTELCPHETALRFGYLLVSSCCFLDCGSFWNAPA